jgi:hypothetical protein
MPTLRLVLAIASLMVPTVALAADPKALPRFEDYPAIDQLVGSPKEPVLRLPVDRNYKTRLRRGVRVGDGLFGVLKTEQHPRPNFAGAFYAITWGCGSDGCAALAIVDGRTGAVFGPPPGGNVTNDNFVATPRTNDCPGIGLRPDSRLLFIDYTSYSSGIPVCQRSYYEWRNQTYRLVLKTSVKPGTADE